MAVSRAVLGKSPELSKQVVNLFRRVCREAPRFCAIYELPMQPRDFRHQINVLFREHQNVTEPRVIEILLKKGEMELEEGVNQWKQRSHVLTLLSVDLLSTEFKASESSEDNDEFEGGDNAYLDRLLSGNRNAGPISARIGGKGAAGYVSPLE